MIGLLHLCLQRPKWKSRNLNLYWIFVFSFRWPWLLPRRRYLRYMSLELAEKTNPSTKFSASSEAHDFSRGRWAAAWLSGIYTLGVFPSYNFHFLDQHPRWFNLSWVSISQFKDQRSNHHRISGQVIENNMGQISLKLFLVTEVCFPGRPRILIYGSCHVYISWLLLLLFAMTVYRHVYRTFL